MAKALSKSPPESHIEAHKALRIIQARKTLVTLEGRKFSHESALDKSIIVASNHIE